MSWLISIGLILSTSVLAQTVEVTDREVDPGASGRAKAAGYFRDRKGEGAARAASAAASEAKPRFLAIHIGTFFSSQGYKWGKGDQTDVGALDAGVDYRLGEWVNAADFALRVNFTGYDLREASARKISVEGLLMFPDANSRFPLYFGLGLGPGFFVKQVKNESVLSLDYGLFAGARLFDVIERIGFMAEVGLKDHLFLLSDGQFNGFYFNLGCVFAF